METKETFLEKLLRFAKSETVRKFLVWVYPHIKMRLSEVGKGRLPFLAEFFYKEFYGETGLIESEDDLVLASQQDTDEPTLSSNDIPAYESSMPLLSGMHKVEYQKSIGTCAVHTVDNITKQFLMDRGLQPTKTNVSLMYKDCRSAGKYAGHDSGTIVSKCYEQLVKRGVPVKTWETILNRKELKALDENKVISNGWDVTLDIWGKTKYWGRDADRLTGLLSTLDPLTHKLQISLDVTRPGYWRTPIIKENTSKKSGRHSVAGVFRLVNGNKVGVFNHSKYGNGIYIDDSGDGQRKFLTFDYFSSRNGIWRIIEMKDDTKNTGIQTVQKFDPSKIVNTNDTLSKTDISKGQKNNKAVVELQTYLERLGYFTYKGSKGTYGNITARALASWERKYLGQSYGGGNWGSKHQAAYRLSKMS